MLLKWPIGAETCSSNKVWVTDDLSLRPGARWDDDQNVLRESVWWDMHPISESPRKKWWPRKSPSQIMDCTQHRHAYRNTWMRQKSLQADSHLCSCWGTHWSVWQQTEKTTKAIPLTPPWKQDVPVFHLNVAITVPASPPTQPQHVQTCGSRVSVSHSWEDVKSLMEVEQTDAKTTGLKK